MSESVTLITSSEAARILRVSLPQARRITRSLPNRTVGNVRLVALEDVEREGMRRLVRRRRR